MKRRIVLALTAAVLGAMPLLAMPGQEPPERTPLPGEDRRDVRLPSGKRQSDEILKQDHERNLRDAADLLKLTEDLKAELEKNDWYVLSLGTIKKTEEIEKVAKRIRSRLKKY